jgi:hypothetical protein
LISPPSAFSFPFPFPLILPVPFPATFLTLFRGLAPGLCAPSTEELNVDCTEGGLAGILAGGGIASEAEDTVLDIAPPGFAIVGLRDIIEKEGYKREGEGLNESSRAMEMVCLRRKYLLFFGDMNEGRSDDVSAFCRMWRMSPWQRRDLTLPEITTNNITFTAIHMV